jgi:hypothetical protein
MAEKETNGAKGSGQREDRPRMVKLTPEGREYFSLKDGVPNP